MAREKPVVTAAEVLVVIDARLYRVRLPNGKELIAHIPARHTPDAPVFSEGDEVTLEMTPFDFSKGRIRYPQS